MWFFHDFSLLNAAEPTKTRAIRVGVFYGSGFFEFDAKGQKSGYCYELLYNMSVYNGWKFKFVGWDKNWDELLQMLASGEIDLLAHAIKTPERLRQFAFSENPSGYSGLRLSCRENDPKIKLNDYANWKNVKIGCLKNGFRKAAFAEYAASNNFTWHSVEFSDIPSMNAALQRGEIDAIACSDSRRTSHEVVYAEFDSEPFYIMMNKKTPELLSQANYALEQIEINSPGLLMELHNKYFPIFSSHDLPLSTEEENFIQQAKAEKRIFKAILNPDRYPISYLENGEIKGVLREIADEIIMHTGLDIRFEPVRNRQEYNQAYDDNKVLLIFDQPYDLTKAESKNLLLTRPYLKFAVVRIYKKDFSGKIRTVAGIPDSDILSEIISSGMHEKSQILYVENFKELIDAVKNGSADVGYVYALSAENALLDDAKNILASEMVYGKSVPFTVGIKNSGDGILSGIINKAVLGLDNDFMNSVFMKYQQRIKPSLSLLDFIRRNLLWVLGIPLLVMLIIAGGALWLIFIRRENYRKAEVLKKMPMRYFVFSSDGRVLQYELGNMPDFVPPKERGMTIDDLPEELRQFSGQIKEVIKTGRTSFVNFQYKNRGRSATLTKLPKNIFSCDAMVWISQDTDDLQKARAESNLNAEQLRMTLKSIGDGVIVTDSGGRITLINSVAEILTGYSASEVHGRKHEEIFKICRYPDNSPVLSPIYNALATGQIVNLANHTDLISRNNERYHIADSAAPILNSEGLIVGAILVFRDVTSEYARRDQLNAALSQAKKLNSEFQDLLAVHKLLLDNIPVYVYAMDINDNYRYTLCNKSCLKLWGLDEREALSRENRNVFLPDLNQPFAVSNEKAGEQNNPVESVIPFSGKDGKPRLGKFFRKRLDLSNNRHWLIGLGVDITEQEKSRQGAQVIRTCLEMIILDSDLEKSIDKALNLVCKHIGADRAYIMQFDHENREISCYKEYSTSGDSLLAQIKKQPYFGRFDWAANFESRCFINFPDLQGKSSVAAMGEVWNEMVKNSNTYSIYCHRILLDGSVWGYVGLAYQDKKCVLSLHELDFIQSVARFIEIMIQRQRTQNQLVSALTQARSADKAKSIFLASMSHEIRTPLNAVIGFSELLKDQTLPEAVQRDYLAGIYASGNALLALINDILDISKLEADKMLFTPVQVDFAALATEVELIFKQKCADKFIVSKNEIGDIPVIFIDKLRLRQILFNLLGNAVKFTENGLIVLKADFEPEDERLGILVIHVIDTGVGITAADQKILFQPFSQAGVMRGTQAAHNGTGLGLSLVSGMLEKMGGTISLKSEFGKGSDFMVKIPHVPYLHRNIDAPAVSAGVADGNFQQLKILVVDDVAINLKVMEAMFRKLGMNILSASNGHAALDILKKSEVDLIFTDLWMPEMNGLELLCEIRGYSKYEDIKIVAVTADTEMLNKNLEADFDGILLKPVTLNGLTDLLKKLASRSC